MSRASRILGLCVLGLVLMTSSVPFPWQAAGAILIVHTPPGTAVPGLQIYLTAVLSDATSGRVAWRNGTMTADALVPMTNLSRPVGGGWEYGAYLPAQPFPTLVTYTITASGPAGSAAQEYTLNVAPPGSSGPTEADQVGWVLTLAAVLSMALSVVTLAYWYTARRLRREVA